MLETVAFMQQVLLGTFLLSKGKFKPDDVFDVMNTTLAALRLSMNELTKVIKDDQNRSNKD